MRCPRAEGTGAVRGFFRPPPLRLRFSQAIRMFAQGLPQVLEITKHQFDEMGLREDGGTEKDRCGLLAWHRSLHCFSVVHLMTSSKSVFAPKWCQCSMLHSPPPLPKIQESGGSTPLHSSAPASGAGFPRAQGHPGGAGGFEGAHGEDPATRWDR